MISVPGGSGKQRDCWECLRRQLPCDGSHPVCNCCRSAGIVCPGYENKKPLTWVAPRNLPAGSHRRSLGAAGTATASATAAKKRQQQRNQKLGQVLPSPPPETNPLGTAPKSLAITASTRVMSQTKSIGGLQFERDGVEIITLEPTATEGEPSTIFRRERGISTSSPSKSTMTIQRRLRSRSASSQLSQLSATTSTTISIDVRPHEWDLFEAIDFYNSQVFPTVRSNQLAPNVFTQPIDTSRLSEFLPSNRHAVIAIAIGCQILYITQTHKLSLHPYHAGPAKELWSTFFHHVGLSLTALHDEIHHDTTNYYSKILRSIHFLSSTEVFMLVSPQLRAHIKGFLSIVKHHGGIAKAMAGNRGLKSITLSFLIASVVVNTTSSSQNQITAAAELDIPDVYKLYTMDIYPPFICPPHLFLDIMHINRLRIPLPTISSVYSSSSEQITMCDIMAHIGEFSPHDWIESSSFANKDQFILLSRIFQAAVAQYACATLSCTSKSHKGDSCQYLKMAYRKLLFALLQEAYNTKLPLHTIYWPAVVAGVVAAAGTPAERSFVENYVNSGAREPFAGAGPLKAKGVLKRFWASGKTGWDDCFKDANVILVA